MAVIGSIRKRGTLLLVVIGVSMLAFILGFNVFDRLFNQGPDNTVAIIGGKNVNIAEYQLRYEDKEALLRILNPQAEINDLQRQQISDEVWNDIINERVFFKEYEKLGISITPAEMNDMLVGRTIHSLIKSQFSNQKTGQFNPQDVANYAAQFEDESLVPEENLEQWRAARAYWAYLQRSIRIDRLQNKYNTLINKSIYVTSKEAESNYKATNNKASIRFVAKSYSMIPDSAIILSDDELRKYFHEFKYKFRQKSSRAIKYVVFAAIPTSKDTAVIRNNMIELLNEFATTADDTSFVRLNSEQNVDPTYYKSKTLNPYIDSALFDAPIGSVTGPILENGYFVIAKKMGEKFSPDSSKARHILLQPQSQQEVEVLRARRDSLFTVLKNGGDFAAIAAQYSADNSNKNDTGNLGWFTEGMMEKNFNDSVFNAKPGQLIKVDTEFGFHIVFVQAQSKPTKKALIGMVSKKINPSDETLQEAYNKASELAFVDKKQKGFNPDEYFEKAVKEKNLMVRDESSITENTRNLMGMDGTRDVIKWALTSKRGDISEVFQNGNNYIVAILTSIRTNGIPKLDDVKKEVEVYARRHKKAKQFIEEFNAALSTANNNIDALALATKLQVNTASDIMFNGFFIPGAGVEQELIGAVFGSKIGELSKPVEGNNAVYVFVTDSINPAPDLPDYSYNKMQLMSQMTSRAATDAIDAVKQKYKIQDRRYLFDMY